MEGYLLCSAGNVEKCNGNSCDLMNPAVRDAPILPANFLEKYVGKSKEQNAGKIGGKLEK